MSINKVKGSPLCAFTVWGPVCSARLNIAHIMACLALLQRLSRFLWSEDVAVGWDIWSHVLSLIAANVQKLGIIFRTSCQNGQMCTPENGARSDFMRDTSQIIRLHLVTFLKPWKNKFDFIHQDPLLNLLCSLLGSAPLPIHSFLMSPLLRGTEGGWGQSRGKGGAGEKEAAGCHVKSSSAPDCRVNGTLSDTSLFCSLTLSSSSCLF